MKMDVTLAVVLTTDLNKPKCLWFYRICFWRMSPSYLPFLFQGLITQLYHLLGMAFKSLPGQFNANKFIRQQGIQKQPRSIIHPIIMITKKPLYEDPRLF
jgi:hypothetical protein